MNLSPHHSFKLAALGLAVCALAACGGGDEAGTTPPVAAPPPPVALPPAPVINAIEGSFQGMEGGISTMTATVTSTGDTPQFQWFEEGVAIPGATSANLSTTPAAFSFSNYMRTFKLRVSHSGGSVEMVRDFAIYASGNFQFQAAQALDNNTLEVNAAATVIDAAGRTHVVYIASAEDGTPQLRSGFVSSEGHGDSFPNGIQSSWTLGNDGSVSAQDLKLAANANGQVMAVWSQTEPTSSGPSARRVKAALYTPNSNPQQAGSWVQLGNVSADASTATGVPAVVGLPGGAFEVVWVDETSGTGQVLARRYVSGAWGSEQSIEGVNEHFYGGGTPVLLASEAGTLVMFVGTTGWYANYRAHGGANTAWVPGNASAIGLSRDHAAPVAAVNAQGTVALASRYIGEGSGDGRAFLRRFDLSSGNWLDTDWAYVANAYGSDPSLLIDANGRIDVFGVSVNTANGFRSVLARWTFTPGVGWGSAQILQSNDGDFRTGFGLREPVVGRDPSGNLVLGYINRPQGSSGVATPYYVRYSAKDQLWGSPLPVAELPSGVQGSDSPLLRVNASGRATMLWFNVQSSGNYSLQASRMQ
jgi:hypothetical protein